MKTLHLVLGVIVVVLLVFVSLPLMKSLVPFRVIKDTQGLAGCPDKIEGNYNADLTIKYFYSSDCIYCLREEKIFEDLLKDKGDLFRLEKYDVNYCFGDVNTYGAYRTPSFVFISKEEYFTRDSFLPRDALERTICRSTGACF